MRNSMKTFLKTLMSKSVKTFMNSLVTAVFFFFLFFSHLCFAEEGFEIDVTPKEEMLDFEIDEEIDTEIDTEEEKEEEAEFKSRLRRRVR